MSTGEPARRHPRNVVRLWKEAVRARCANELRRRRVAAADDFLTVLAQSKHLRYANRNVYAEVDERALRQMDGATASPRSRCLASVGWTARRRLNPRNPT